MARSISRANVCGETAPASSLSSRMLAWVSRLSCSVWWKPALKTGFLLVLVVGLSWFGSSYAASPSLPPLELDSGLALASSSARPREASPSGSSARPASSVAPPASGSGVLADGRVVLNLATVEELCKLPGIGPSRANKILALRDKQGRFKSVRDLRKVRGIGVKSLKRLEPLVVLDPPSDSKLGT